MKNLAAVFLATVIFMLSLPAVCAGRLIGEVNNDGTVNSLDAAQILKHDARLITFEGVWLDVADVNTDGAVNSLDAALVLKYDAKLINGFGTLPQEDSVSSEETEEESSASSEETEEMKAETADEWLSNITFGINYFNGINEDNDNDAYFKWISEQGFNAVEIGCRYGHLVDGVYGDLNLEYVEKLRNIIDCAYEYDFYIILTLYDGYDYMWTSLNYENQDSIIQMLNTSYKKLVENLNSYDDKLSISFCSEPRDYTDNLIDEEACEVLNNVNKEFVKMVRSTGGNNLYRKLVITTGWSKWDGLAASRFEMVDDEYTFVRIHLYEPDKFAGSKTEEYVWDEVGHQLTLVDSFKALKKNFIDKGIPVYIGEFGCRPKDNDEERIKWARCYLSLANSHNVKCFIWDTENKGSGIANSFAISNKQKLEWLNPLFMNYILDMFKNQNFVDYYDSYSYSINITEPIELERTVTDILTGEEKTVTVSCDSDKLVLLDGKYYAKEVGEITFAYSINGFNYYYIVEVTEDIGEVDFEMEIITNADTGYLQLRITTAGYSKTRLDYDWRSTNEDVIRISKYSTITILSDGECSIIAKHRETGAVGMIDVVVANGEIADVFVHTT
ncbi:MAG: hypothetical protein E7597_05060 [Ruminococcaceae bacterium]|nr:hypothetical protein [Oscillospiraceae bacterium]